MDSINEILFDIVAFPNKLGAFILEEGVLLKNNITAMRGQFQWTDEQIAEVVFASISLGLSSLLAFIFIKWYFSSPTPVSKNSASSNNGVGNIGDGCNGDGCVGVNPGNKGKGYPQIKASHGLYLQSVSEVNNAGAKIIPMFDKGNTYWILLRVHLRNPMNMVGTKFKLHGNNTIGNTEEAFQTRDSYLMMRFKVIADITTKDYLFGNVIVRFLNHLNQSTNVTYLTEDFVVVAIGTGPVTEPDEFRNGLIHIGYEMENYIEVNAFTPDGKHSIEYALMLPVHGIYDLFMDVYNTCLFESKKYIIDDDNYESWNGKSINELVF